jgi:soluble lytic murein transglycosylase
MGRTEDAHRWYERAARYAATYYGQLAAHYLGSVPKPAPVPADAIPSPERTAAFNRSELVRIAHMLHELGNGHDLSAFVLQAAKISPDPAQKVLAAHLARTLGRPDLGVRVARTAYRDGVLLLADGYPVIPTPDGTPERALLLAVARQESNFNPKAESWAGAVGLMQLMPATAKSVARLTKTRYAPKRLVEPAYNIALGRAYLAMLLDQFNGSYVLALGAYNEGPGNVARWIRTYGDPRDIKVDAVDWVEMIPYNETRNYVQQVMANLQVYRQRLGASQLASMAQDLRR